MMDAIVLGLVAWTLLAAPMLALVYAEGERDQASE